MRIRPSHVRVKMREIFCRIAAAAHPYAGLRMQDENSSLNLTTLRTNRQSCAVCLHNRLILPPRRLVIQNRGIVSLSQALYGILRKVRTADGNSHNSLPIPKPFLPLEAQLPSGAAIRFTDCRPSPLIRNAGALLCCEVFFGSLSENVDSRYMEIAVMRHSSSADTRL